MALVQTGSAFALNAAGTYNAATGSIAITVPADADLVVIGVSGFAGTAGLLSASGCFDIGGNTSVGVASGTGHWRSGLHYIVSPATGSVNLDWQWGGGAGTALDDPEVGIIYAFYKGVDTASPTRSSGVNDAAAATLNSPSLTCATGDLLVAMGATFDGANAELTYTWASGTISGTSLIQGTHQTYMDHAMATASPTGNGTIGWAATGADEGGIAAWVFKAAAGGGGAAPFSQEDWPVTRSKKAPTESLTHSATKYIGRDKFFAADGEAPTYSWPNPRGPQWPNDMGFTASTKLLPLTGVQLKPTLDRVIPNPTLRVPVNDRGYIDPTEYWLLAPVLTQNPFSMSDWAVPKGMLNPIGNYTFTFYYVQDDSQPFVQSWTDIPMVRKRYGDILGFSSSKFANLNDPLPTARQTDWPVPWGAKRHTQLVELLRNRPFYFTDPPLPFGQSSWPVPRGPLSASDLKLLWNSLNAILPPPEALVVFSRLALLGAG